MPVRPWFSVFNSVLYEDAGSLPATLPILADQYERAGVGARNPLTQSGLVTGKRLKGWTFYKRDERRIRDVKQAIAGGV